MKNFDSPANANPPPGRVREGLTYQFTCCKAVSEPFLTIVCVNRRMYAALHELIWRS